MPYIKQDRRAVINDWLTLVQNYVAGDTAVTVETLRADMPKDCGELNYALTMTCIGHGEIGFGALDRKLNTIGRMYLVGAPLRYQRINDLIGACHGAAMELARRRPGAKRFEIVSLYGVAEKQYRELGVAYELQKIEENGDIDFGESADAAAIRAKERP